jgi:A/G-specific adenine glycosylase
MTDRTRLAIRRALLEWYAQAKRDLPWRRTKDPYLILVSEVMLQQTRVAAMASYFERFVQRFPTAGALAAAGESEVLHAWSGLGYYSRARNLQKAAIWINGLGVFPDDYHALRALPGVGDYTAAAVASIAFGRPYPAVDGNALRVLSRITADAGDIASPETRERLTAVARALLDRKQPGDFNQAVMELGATVCVPRSPACAACPVARYCEAHATGRERDYPVKLRKPRRSEVHETLYFVEREDHLLLWRREEESERLAGFWELPGRHQLGNVAGAVAAGEFRHTIVNTTYHFRIVRASVQSVPGGVSWIPKSRLRELPLSTATKKALRCVEPD